MYKCFYRGVLPGDIFEARAAAPRPNILVARKDVQQDYTRCRTNVVK